MSEEFDLLRAARATPPKLRTSAEKDAIFEDACRQVRQMEEDNHWARVEEVKSAGLIGRPLRDGPFQGLPPDPNAVWGAIPGTSHGAWVRPTDEERGG